MQRKLIDFGEVRGLVFGAFGECSDGVYELVQQLANHICTACRFLKKSLRIFSRRILTEDCERLLGHPESHAGL